MAEVNELGRRSMAKRSMQWFLAAGVAACALAMAVAPGRAEAQEFTLRAGADIRPLVAFGGPDGVKTAADQSWLGLTVAPGLKLAKIATVELAVIPQIPLTGTDNKFHVGFAPGVLLDLFVIYARLSFPLTISNGVNYIIEGAAGFSFLGSGYIGLLVDYIGELKEGSLGAEVGFKF
jgi:hypothetical protein